MRSRCLLLGSLLLVVPLPWAVAPAEPAKDDPAAVYARDVVPFLTRHCYECHGNGKKRGGLALDKYKDDVSLQKDRKTWDHVLHMIRTGEMPPKDAKKPAAKDVEAVARSIEVVLNTVDCKRARDVGRVTLRRLNKVEYNNTIRDLVGIDFKPAADFPNDDVGYGFDNIGDVLSLSPLLLEKYLAAAESILERAVVIPESTKPTNSRLGGLRVSPQEAGETPRGAAFLKGKGDVWGESYFSAGDYVIRAEVYGQQVGDEPVRASIRVNRNDVKEFEVKAERDKPVTLEAKLRLRTGTARVAVAFLNPSPAPKADDKDKKQRQLFVRSIEVDGPYNPPPPVLPEHHERIMAHTPDLKPREAAAEIVTRFATAAFRRPVKPTEIERFLKLYDKADKAGEGFENRVRLALNGVLVSPHFLFRVELDPPDAKAGTAYLVNEYELASRLSYFLWSTMPDAELLKLAAEGKLREKGVIEGQVKRMLKNPKSAAFVQNFAGQWLTLRGLANVSPDAKLFPDFDDELRAAMYRETELFFDAVLREDRNILDLLDADFSFVNERLAKHYGIEGVKGKEFRRVKLPANRGGILTHASILTLTSNPTRTSPVKRGKWVLEQILSSPPPPPPEDVPDLDEKKQLTGSLRKVMEMHREKPICASCHQRMDPIGFAFENYDAVGAWRDKDGKFDVDASGTLPDGKSFKGPAELKAILKGKKELFGRSLTEKVLTYAMGRGVEYYDRCAVDKVVEALEKNEYRFSTLLIEVVKSEPFQMRMATGEK